MAIHLDPQVFRSSNDAFTAALSVLTPEIAARHRAVVDEAIAGQWPFQRLRDALEAEPWPSPEAQGQRGGCQ